MEMAQKQADLCNAIGDLHRLLILYALAEEPCNVSTLVQRLGLAQPSISRHLKILRDCGAVVARREGKAVYYSTSDPRLIEALDLFRTVLMDQMKQEGEMAQHATHRPLI